MTDEASFGAALTRLWPHAPQPLLDGIITTAPAVFEKYGFTPLVIAHFMAQVSEECAAGLEMQENMNYSAGRLLAVFPRHFNHDQAIELQHQPRLIAVSGTNFRVFPDPGAGACTATLRYYQKLATPAGATANAILTGSPDVYLYGCLVEASIFTQDEPGALRYLALHNASVAGLNARTQRITGSSVPVIRVRAGMAP